MKNLCPSCGMITQTIGKLCLECQEELAGAVAEVASRVLRDAEMFRLKEIVRDLEKTMQCNCDLDRWQPEQSTGHSWVCNIHKLANRLLAAGVARRVRRDTSECEQDQPVIYNRGELPPHDTRTEHDRSL